MNPSHKRTASFLASGTACVLCGLLGSTLGRRQTPPNTVAISQPTVASAPEPGTLNLPLLPRPTLDSVKKARSMDRLSLLVAFLPGATSEELSELAQAWLGEPPISKEEVNFDYELWETLMSAWLRLDVPAAEHFAAKNLKLGYVFQQVLLKNHPERLETLLADPTTENKYAEQLVTSRLLELAQIDHDAAKAFYRTWKQNPKSISNVHGPLLALMYEQPVLAIAIMRDEPSITLRYSLLPKLFGSLPTTLAAKNAFLVAFDSLSMDEQNASAISATSELAGNASSEFLFELLPLTKVHTTRDELRKAIFTNALKKRPEALSGLLRQFEQMRSSLLEHALQRLEGDHHVTIAAWLSSRTLRPEEAHYLNGDDLIKALPLLPTKLALEIVANYPKESYEAHFAKQLAASALREDRVTTLAFMRLQAANGPSQFVQKFFAEAACLGVSLADAGENPTADILAGLWQGSEATNRNSLMLHFSQLDLRKRRKVADNIFHTGDPFSGLTTEDMYKKWRWALDLNGVLEVPWTRISPFISELRATDIPSLTARLPDHALEIASGPLTREWLKIDAQEASTWVRDLPRGLGRDSAARAIVEHLGTKSNCTADDARAAVIWLQEMQDEMLCKITAKSIAGLIDVHDSPELRAAAGGLPEAVQQELWGKATQP